MNNEEMFMTILDRMDTMESKLDTLGGKVDHLEDKVDHLEEKVDHLEDKVDNLESNMNMEFQAVRTEMEFVHNSLKQEIDMVNGKVDRLIIARDVEEYDQIKVRVDVLEKGYLELKEKIV